MPTAPSPSRRAFTLFELLVVVVLLGLVAVLAMPTLARRAVGDPLDQAVQKVLSGEERVRRLAVGHGVHLELTDSGFVAQVDEGPDAQGGRDDLDGKDAQTVEVHLDPVYILTWRRNGQPVHNLVIDPRGRSLDCAVTVEGDRTQRTFQLAGLSGEWNEDATP